MLLKVYIRNELSSKLRNALRKYTGLKYAILKPYKYKFIPVSNSTMLNIQLKN